LIKLILLVIYQGIIGLFLLFSCVKNPVSSLQITDTDWSALSSGVNNTVYSLACDKKGNLYAGGYFTISGGVNANYISKWNGTTWSGMGNIDTSSYSPKFIASISFDSNGNIYAGGMFQNNPSKWVNNSWTTLGFNCWAINIIACDRSGALFIGGNFGTCNNANCIVKWDGISCFPLGSGVKTQCLTSGVCALCFDGSGNLYAGGGFDSIGGIQANSIAKWNGAIWTSLGSGVSNGSSWCNGAAQGGAQVNAIISDASGNLYVAGNFTFAGGIISNCIAKWNGVSWSTLGNGVSGVGGNNAGIFINALTFDQQGNLYAGGNSI
jgi:hypothetical protein